MKNKWVEKEDHIEISIKYKDSVHFCKVNKEDFEKVSNIKGTWSFCINKTSNKKNSYGYARYYFWIKDGKNLKIQSFAMHHIILEKPKKGFVIDHINFDTLDNRRCNLRTISFRENVKRRRFDRKGFRLRLKKGKWELTSSKRPNYEYVGTFKTKKEALTAAIPLIKEANIRRNTWTPNFTELLLKHLAE